MTMIGFINFAIQMVFWGFVSWKDAKIKLIPVKACVLTGCAGGILAMVAGLSFFEIAGGISLGIIFCGLAFLTEELIGYGDGICIASMGAWLGGKKMVMVLTMTMFLLLLTGGCLLLQKKATRKSRLPMIPFLYISMCFITFLEIGEGL